MVKFLGKARTVDELIEMIKPYSGFDVLFHGSNYETSKIYVYKDEEKKIIELN